MSVFVPGQDHDPASTQIPRLDFELASGCDHRCAHCYNVWTASDGDPQAGFEVGRPLSTPDLKAMMTKAVTQSGATHLTLTGGEPLLRKDAVEIIAHACGLASTVTLITNGSHVTEEVAAALADAGLTQVQLTLLAGNRELHDRLKGAVCFDDTVRSAVRLADAGVSTQCCYVAMKENESELKSVIELCVALGFRGISYNRMSPTGRAIHHIERLLPDIDSLERDLDLLERLGKRWKLQVGTAMPIPPCLIRTDRYQWVRFGYCSTGSSSPNIVIDAKGDVRSCNLSSTVLGNMLEQDWSAIYANPYPRTFKGTLPEMCRGCAYERTCQGGCKESSHATFGSHTSPDPLVWLALDPERRAALADTVWQHE